MKSGIKAIEKQISTSNRKASIVRITIDVNEYFHVNLSGLNEVVINPDNNIFLEYANKPYMEQVSDIEMSKHDIHSLGSNLAGDRGNALREKKECAEYWKFRRQGLLRSGKIDST